MSTSIYDFGRATALVVLPLGAIVVFGLLAAAVVSSRSEAEPPADAVIPRMRDGRDGDDA